MHKLLLLSFLCLSVSFCTAQSKDEAAVRAVLAEQVNDWNKGDLTHFMEGYWKNDSVMFVGHSGITYGWQNTLDHYKKGYPDTVAMGKLDFTLLQVKRLSAEYFFVTGRFHLLRSIGDQQGYFNLLFRKVKGRWVIVCDHTS